MVKPTWKTHNVRGYSQTNLDAITFGEAPTEILGPVQYPDERI